MTIVNLLYSSRNLVIFLFNINIFSFKEKERKIRKIVLPFIRSKLIINSSIPIEIVENHDFSMENILRRLKVGINILSKFYASREEKYAFYRFSDNASIGSFISFLRFPSRKSKIVSINFIFCYIPSSYDEYLFSWIFDLLEILFRNLILVHLLIVKLTIGKTN